MFEFEIRLFNKAESLLGVMIDQGDYQKKDGEWIEFIRFRIGFIFINFDFVKYQK
jgi:hypothetical protein